MRGKFRLTNITKKLLIKMTNEDKITHIVINAQILNNRLSDAIADKMFKQALKQKAKNFLEELISVEHKWYNEFFNNKENSTIDVYDVYDKFMQEIANVPIYEMKI